VSPIGVVITVFRGGCEIVHEDRVLELHLTGSHARDEVGLAVGDEVSFDAERLVVLERQPRRTRLARLRPQGGRRRHDPSHERVLAANVDRVAICTAVRDPPFRSGAVDRFMLAAAAGGLEALLVVNKIDLLRGEPLPDEIEAYRGVLPLVETSATEGVGLDALRAHLADSRTVFAGHSGVGKSSLLNALEPELRLETGALRERARKGRHTTTHAVWLRLAGGAIVVDTPGVREIATGRVDPDLLGDVYPDIVSRAGDCRFRDCRHDKEPRCAVRAAIEAGELHPGRLASYEKLRAELASSD
jgi:ribosome biogenesis GTPase